MAGIFQSRASLATDDIHREGMSPETDQVSSREQFSSLSITEILDQDPRPTFVIDLDPDDSVTTNAKSLSPIFCNSALRVHESLFDVVVGRDAAYSPAVYENFSTWATGPTKSGSSKDVVPRSCQFFDLIWTGSTVRKRWRLISGMPTCDFSADPAEALHGEQQPAGAGAGDQEQKSLSWNNVSLSLTEGSKPTAIATLISSRNDNPSLVTGSSSDTTSGSSQSQRLILGTPEKAVVDWTIPNPKGVLSPHIKFARTVPWENTPLGSMAEWSKEFRQIANLVMLTPWFYGPFSEVWDSVKDIFAECGRTGVSVRREDDFLPIERRGFLEETFYSWSWTPLYGGTNQILGFYNSAFETTKSVLSQRRMQAISEMGASISRAKTMKDFWKLLLEALEHNHCDVPFALLYSVGENEDEDQSSISSESTTSLRSCFLEGAIGVPKGHIAAPQQMDLKRSRQGFVPAFREAMRTREPTLLQTRDGSLPEELLEGIKFRGFGEPCREAVIFPVRPTNGDLVLAFLVIGVNPRRPYDDGYRAFTSMLNRQLATSLASYMLFEGEVRRSRDMAVAAALEQQKLSHQLALQTNRLRRMTELSPLGMFLIDPDGILQEANERYFQMTGHPRGKDFTPMSWKEPIEAASINVVEDGWDRMAVDHLPWTGEIRLKRLPVQPVGLDGKAIDYWVMVTAHPEFAPDGSLRSVMGSITDISHLKWVQGLQARQIEEAEETRRQQNEFIDITSHEMRNPLSAILQCADDILSTLKEHRSCDRPPGLEDVNSCIESAQTISLCVQHQKSIVDDILTVSKLDSSLLALTPTTAQPAEVVGRVVRMFEPELQAKDIRMVCTVEPSFAALGVDWVTLDPSRVLQILINLVTNAIKFTSGSAERQITLSVGVSRDPPLFSHAPGCFRYIPTRTRRASALEDLPGDEDGGSGGGGGSSGNGGDSGSGSGSGWGDGELLCVHFQVQDTGCGLTPAEVDVLFERFSQASPRTHAQYGGSGLGLFISRQLAELHGGQVGVSSQAARGSTFGFFIKARRASAPQSPSPPLRSSLSLLTHGGDHRRHHHHHHHQYHHAYSPNIERDRERNLVGRRRSTSSKPQHIVAPWKQRQNRIFASPSPVPRPAVVQAPVAAKSPAVNSTSTVSSGPSTRMCSNIHNSSTKGEASATSVSVPTSTPISAPAPAPTSASAPARLMSVPKLDDAHDHDNDNDGKKPRDHQCHNRHHHPFDPRELEVLVVEDNLVNQNVLVRQLRKTGAGVSAAGDGVEALAFLEASAWVREDGRPLSVVLMDLEMPNMDGLACVREIRRMEAAGIIARNGGCGGGGIAAKAEIETSTKATATVTRAAHVPVIAVTANVRDEQVAIARRAGMDDVVSKPFRIPDLLAKIEVLLSLSPAATRC
ncbi:hypothetical protein SLS62_007311 [Diatrype stigma]|uniref:Uncharacterized protein n=1 Tax=Diatrype stigma TaxID=117547 RepID=A0AAN9ULH2_9PEZI